MRDRERERQAEGEADSMQGARCGTRSQDPRIMPWAKGSAKSLSHPGGPMSGFFPLSIMIVRLAHALVCSWGIHPFLLLHV